MKVPCKHCGGAHDVSPAVVMEVKCPRTGRWQVLTESEVRRPKSVRESRSLKEGPGAGFRVYVENGEYTVNTGAVEADGEFLVFPYTGTGVVISEDYYNRASSADAYGKLNLEGKLGFKLQPYAMEELLKGVIPEEDINVDPAGLTAQVATLIREKKAEVEVFMRSDALSEKASEVLSGGYIRSIPKQGSVVNYEVYSWEDAELRISSDATSIGDWENARATLNVTEEVLYVMQDMDAMAYGDNDEDDELEESTSGESNWWLNHYKCPQCDTEWDDEWSAQSNDECPNCGLHEVEPYESEDLHESKRPRKIETSQKHVRAVKTPDAKSWVVTSGTDKKLVRKAPAKTAQGKVVIPTAKPGASAQGWPKKPAEDKAVFKKRKDRNAQGKVDIPVGKVGLTAQGWPKKAGVGVRESLPASQLNAIDSALAKTGKARTDKAGE